MKTVLNLMKTQQVDEEEESIRLLLMEDEPDIDQAIDRLYRHLKRGIVSFVDRKHPTLDTDDQVSVVNDAFAKLAASLKKDEVDLNVPLPPLLLTIADRTAIDLVRKRNRKGQPNLQFEEEKFMDTLTSLDWHRKKRRNEAKGILDEIRTHIASSSGLTKAVGEALLSLVPPRPSPEELLEAVEHITGKPTTLPSVSSALSNLRKDLRKIVTN